MGNVEDRLAQSGENEKGYRIAKRLFDGFLALIALAVVGGLTLLIWISWLVKDDVIDHRNDWPAYYASTVSNDFYIPESAEIVTAEDWSGFPMNRGHTVRFKLADTKTPEEWMIELVDKSPILDREDRAARYIYELPGVYYRLEYIPHEELYKAYHVFD